MSVAIWMVGAAAVLPYVCAGAAKFGGPGYDNAAPRQFLAGLSGWRARADWAQRNHFEAFPPFAAGVLAAIVMHARPGLVDGLAAGFVVARVLYTVAYIADWATVRSVVWAAGVACVVGLFCAAA